MVTEAHPHCPQRSWFAKRAAAVEELRLYIPQPVGTMLLLEPSFPIPAGLLHDGAGPTPPLPLRKIAISCPAAATLSFGVGDVSPAHWLPSLQKVGSGMLARQGAPNHVAR